MSSDSRASKRRRQCVDDGGGDDEAPLDLLALYQSDIGDRILSYASGQIYVHLTYSAGNSMH